MKKLIYIILLCNTYLLKAQCPDISSVPSELVCGGNPYIFTLASSGGVPGNWTQYGGSVNLTQTLPYSANYIFTPFPAPSGCYADYFKTIYLIETPLPIFDESTFPYITCPGITPPPIPMPTNGVQGFWQPSTIIPNFSSIYRFYPNVTISGCSTKYVEKYISSGNLAQFANFPVVIEADINNGLNSVAVSRYSVAATPTTPNIFPVLPTTSLPTVVYGRPYPAISGTWSPSTITYFHGVKQYVFTPNSGQCAYSPITLYVTMEANLFNECGQLQEMKNPEEEINRTYRAIDIVSSQNYQVTTVNQNIVLIANAKIDLLPNSIFQSSTFFEARIDENQCIINRQANPLIINNVEVSEKVKSLLVYPNPSSNSIEVLIENETLNKVIVLSIEGKTVYNKVIENVGPIQIDISSYANGIYIVQAISNDGNLFSQKLIKN